MIKTLTAFALALLATTAQGQVAISNPSSTADPSAMLDVKSTSRGALLPRMTYTQRIGIATPAQGLMVYQTNTSTTPRGFYIYDGTAWREMAKTEDIAAAGGSWTVSGSNQYSGVSGNVGVGTVSPDEKLDIVGNVKMSGSARLIRFETAVGGTGSPFTSLRYAPGLQFIREGTTTGLGKIEYVDTADFSNFLRLYTGATASNDLTINTAHDVGIGTQNPVARLHVVNSGSEHLRLTGSDAAIQFTDGGGILAQNKKAFLDLSGNDFRIGTNTENNAGRFIIRVNGTNTVHVTPAASVGIGTASPESKLHVVGRTTIDASGEALKLDGNNAQINFYQNGAFKSFLQHTASGLYMGVNDGNIRLDVTNGQVAVGPVVAGGAGYKLSVNGKVICEELKVKLSGAWPDYVFAKEYKLMPLSQLQGFIQTNRHLPNIPSAAEVEKEGITVGEMQKKLMEKVEELTLYILQLEERLRQLEKAKTQTP